MRTSFLLIIILANAACGEPVANGLRLFKADNTSIQYYGRIDFSNPLKPRFWSPGVYIKAKFRGPECQLLINDEMNGQNHNYIEISIDNGAPSRIKLTAKTNVINAAQGLTNGGHIITICKDTESGIGYLELTGIKCRSLLPLPGRPVRKIEYIGDSITAGTGMDVSAVPCGQGQWYDQHNAWMSYGPRTSRELGAQWELTAVAGIGMTHSCCNMDIILPQVTDKIDLRDNKMSWDFKRYQPDVVTICVGQNDGITDSTLFCKAYVQFIDSLRINYPKADIICLTSPMAKDSLTAMLKNYLSAVTAYLHARGDKKIYKYFFSQRYHNGCGGHPDLQEHALIADELTAYIKQVEDW